MSRRQTSQPAPNERAPRSSSSMNARQLVAWAAVGLTLAAGSAWFFFSDASLDSEDPALGISDQNSSLPRPTPTAPSGGTLRRDVPAAVRNVSWPLWDEQQNEDADA